MPSAQTSKIMDAALNWMINTLRLPFYPLLPIFVHSEAYVPRQRSQGSLIYQYNTAFPAKKSDLNNHRLGEVRDDGHSVQATRLNCRTDLINFIRKFRPLCMTFATSRDILAYLVGLLAPYVGCSGRRDNVVPKVIPLSKALWWSFFVRTDGLLHSYA